MSVKNYPKKMPIIYKSGNKKSLPSIFEESEKNLKPIFELPKFIDNSSKSNDLCYNKTKEELCEENYYILNQFSKLKNDLEKCKPNIYQIIPRSYDSALVVAKYAGLNPDNLILDYFNNKSYADITKREYFNNNNNNNNNNLNSCLDIFKFTLLLFLLFLLFQIKKV